MSISIFVWKLHNCQKPVSSTRRNKRRTHDKLSAPTLVVCPECGEYKMSHRVCKHCGTYKGVKVK